MARWFRRERQADYACSPLKNYYDSKHHLKQLSPDIDVAAAKGDTLLGCEVKLFAGQAAGQTAKLLGGVEKGLAAVDRQIYSGLGQALFLLRYVHQAYLALPDLDLLVDKEDMRALADVRFFLLKELLDYLPIGLISFSPREGQARWEFQLVREARLLPRPMGVHISYIAKAIKKHDVGEESQAS